ncbi:MAG: hypothetical protein K2X90_00560 [Candidatus Babeliaceae bacterium]|nr:hypothetical protein [Candidatus Babeliaceae bacterium]
MTIKINKEGYEHALEIIKNGLEVEHETSNWKEIKPDVNEMAQFLNTHSLKEYGLWFLGIDTDADQNSKDKYVYPYGDFSVLHKSGLIAAEQEAGNKHNHEIKSAAQKLLAMINQNKK